MVGVLLLSMGLLTFASAFYILRQAVQKPIALQGSSLGVKYKTFFFFTLFFFCLSKKIIRLTFPQADRSASSWMGSKSSNRSTAGPSLWRHWCSGRSPRSSSLQRSRFSRTSWPRSTSSSNSLKLVPNLLRQERIRIFFPAPLWWNLSSLPTI